VFFFHLVFVTTIQVCSIWTSEIISQVLVYQTCPILWQYDNITILDMDDYLITRAVWVPTGEVRCSMLGNTLPTLPCDVGPQNMYRFEVVKPDSRFIVCTVTKSDRSTPTGAEIAAACPRLTLGDWNAIDGPFDVPTSAAVKACTLPQVDNSAPMAAAPANEFLPGRLAWYGLYTTPAEWSNQWDENIRGAADAAGVSAAALKTLMVGETLLWTNWTGDAGEVGLIQLTFDGADTALRHSPDLYAEYCSRALYWQACGNPYDTLASWQQDKVRTILIADLNLTGHPLERAEQIKSDLWAYAQVLRAYACEATAQAGSFPGWETVIKSYNTGTNAK
jgi:hypothetical protein